MQNKAVLDEYRYSYLLNNFVNTYVGTWYSSNLQGNRYTRYSFTKNAQKTAGSRLAGRDTHKTAGPKPGNTHKNDTLTYVIYSINTGTQLDQSFNRFHLIVCNC